MIGTSRAWAIAFLIGLGMTALSLALHFAPVWITMLNQGNFTWDHTPLPYDFLVDCIREHREVAAFARRPLMTWSIDGLSMVGVAPAVGFVVVGNFFFLIAGLLVFRSALRMGSSLHGAHLAQVTFHASPTILFAWFTPIYTYDEPIQYATLLIAILAWSEGRSFTFMIAFALAMMARETSILLIPSLLFLAPPKPNGQTGLALRTRQGITLSLPILLYGTFLWFWHTPVQLVPSTIAELLDRSKLISFNFQSVARSAEAFWYFYLVMSSPLFLLLRYHSSAVRTAFEHRVTNAFLLALLVNTLVVLFMAQAREARLFALPLLLAWPLFGKVWLSEMERHGGWRNFISHFLNVRAALIFGALACIIYFIVLRAFPMTTGIQQDNPFHEYITLQSLFMAACLLADRHTARSLPKQDLASISAHRAG